MPITPPPPISVPDPTGDYARAQSWSVLMAKYADAGNWAQWAAGLLNAQITDITNLLGSDIVGNDLAGVLAAINGIDLYTPSLTPMTYTAPTAPTYEVVPAYAAPTLGTITSIPAVSAITVGSVPSSTMTFANSAFTDPLLTALSGKLTTDLGTQSTGLGSAETALFARETARQNAARAVAYTEITTQFSDRGFDLPPGALLAKQTELNNESNIRLSDSSSQIMAESARLAQEWNKATLSASTQLLDMVSRVFDSKIMRDFEAEKTRVTLSLEGFKQEVSVALAKAELNKTAITATVAANEGAVKVFQAQIEGQVAPIKAIADTNQAKASAYNAAVQASAADLNAQAIPEELKLKGVGVNAQIAASKADIVLREALVQIEQKGRQLNLEVTTLQGLAQGAQQMVASALNTVSSSASFGWGASASTGYDGNISEKIASAEKIAKV